MATNNRQIDNREQLTPAVTELFGRYRAACPDVEPSANFMPVLWDRIEKRGSVSALLPKFARLAAAGTAATCLFLTMLIAMPGQSSRHPASAAASYADALFADHSAEKTYYTESVRSTDNLVPEDYRH
jgi:hypothetical protein